MKKVLLTPLDWGLGHATRCIPVIRALLDKGYEVQIAGSGNSMALLRQEFPSLMFFELPGYDPVYPTSGSMVWKMAQQLPKFIRTIGAEHKRVEELVRKNNISLVISDNRFGCWSARVPSVFITHQSNILMPKRFGWLSRWVRIANERQMKKFTLCWIPDFPGEHSLSGDLISFGKYSTHISVDFIGPLSRFSPASVAEKVYDVVALCSGPEPQRTLLENMLSEELVRSSLRFLLVRGVPDKSATRRRLGEGEVVDFLNTEQLQKAMTQTDLVIARSGYSTVMDMMALKKKAIFIPTPGQTEQEYLANRLKEKGVAYSAPQNEFSLTAALHASLKYSGFQQSYPHNDLLARAIDKVVGC
jgi:uncharacterized protein (TIGR00661 family)